MQRIALGNDTLASAATDYGDAVIHLVWVVERNTPHRILICASVELLPTEMPAPLPLGERHTTLSPRHFLYTREVVTSAGRALKWFDDAASGRAVRPNEDGSLSDDASSPTFVVEKFEYEPTTPSFVTPSRIVPFMAAWHSCARVRHLIAEASPFRMWTDAECGAAVTWLKAECDVDLELFSEYAGSIHLIAPNPVFRDLFKRRDRDDKGWFLSIAFTPRREMRVKGLHLTLEEERATGVGLLAVVVVDEPLMRIDLPHITGALRTRVVDMERGLLFDEGFAVFGVGFTMRTNLVSETRKVTVDDDDSYEVSLSGMGNVSHIPPQAPPQPAIMTLQTAAATRERRERAAQSQMWFRERALDGAKALRALVGAAEGRVFVCDPYFGGDDVFRLILAIADSDVDVQILTSAMHLRRRARAECRHLEKKLQDARGMPPTNPIAVRVMRGKHPAIHDRFIKVNDAMWALGSSINNFGGRGTLLTKLIDPEPVATDLARIWASSPTLDEWAAEPDQVA